MAVTAMTKLLQHPLQPTEVRGVLRDAAQEAFRRNWTYMEATFQLGQRAEALGLDAEIVEAEIREIFDAERRKDDFDGDTPEGSEIAQPGITSHHAKTLINRKRNSKFFNIESMEIPWPTDQWRLDLARLLRSTFAVDENCQILHQLDAKGKDTKVQEILSHEQSLLGLMKKFDGPGAFVRVNPVLEGGRSLFRHLLLEVKGLELGRQLAFFKIFNLPCSALVNGGGRTIQAWVRLDARNREEFDERSVFMVRVLRELGFEVDVHSGNPLAPAWMPGAMISGKQCYVIETEVGAPSFEEWKSWAEAYLDGDPLVESSLSYQEAPPKNTEVINKLFRQGHRVLLAGEAHIGKSFMAIDLALSVAHGEEWLGYSSEETGVLFVNVESESSTFVGRVFEVANAKSLPSGHSHLDYLHLMGLNKNTREFVEFLVHRIESMKKWENKRYTTVIIDGLVEGIEARGEELGASLGILLDRLVVHSGVAVLLTARSERLKTLAPLFDTIVEVSSQTTEDAQMSAELSVHGRYLKQRSKIQLQWQYPLWKRN